MFGDQTYLKNGTTGKIGFKVLLEYDDNHDGKIDATDGIWTELKIWQDANLSGITDAGELHGLGDFNIKSISLASTPLIGTAGVGSYTTADGASHTMTDLIFQTKLWNTIPSDWLPLPDDIAALPNLSGYGTVPDLHQAMVKDTSGSLETLMKQFVTEPDRAVRESLLDQILLVWTNSQNIDPHSRYNSFYRVDYDARKLHIIEQFNGQGLVQPYADSGRVETNPIPQAEPLLDQSYVILFEMIYTELMAQTHLQNLLDDVALSWDGTTQRVKANGAGAVSAIADSLAADHSAGLTLVNEFARFLFITDRFNADDVTAMLNQLRQLGADVAAAVNREANWQSGLTLQGSAGADVLVGSAGRDFLSGGTGNDILNGGYSNDYLDGGAGNDTLNGEAGNDQLYGGFGDDTLDGGLGVFGDDTLDGGSGNDTFVFDKGDGQDRIIGAIGQPDEIDTVRFGSQIRPADIVVSRDVNQLILSVSGTGDRLTVESYFQEADGLQVDRFEFADGTVWDFSAIKSLLPPPVGTAGDDRLYGFNTDDSLNGLAGNDYIEGRGGSDTLTGGDGNDVLDGGSGNDSLDGGAGNDTLSGQDGNDRLDGGAGNDSLQGGLGSDTYVFGPGYGRDAVNDYDYQPGNVDTVSLTAAVQPADLTVTRDASNLYLSLNGGADQLTLHYWNYGDSYRIERVAFANGTVWDAAELQRRIVPLPATAQDDRLYGGPANDTIQGLGGNDYVEGGGGDDVLGGGAGNDTLLGNEGNDTLDGGAGDDSLQGGAGNDVYVFGAGYGRDVVSDYDYSNGNQDTVRLASGVAASGLIVTKDAFNLYLDINGGNDRLTLQSWSYGAAYRIEQLMFADGTVWSAAELERHVVASPGTAGDDTLYGGVGDDVMQGLGGNDTLLGDLGNDTLDGGAGDDTLQGGAGNDIYIFGPGYGKDVVSEYDASVGNQDTVRLTAGVSPLDLTVRNDGQNLYLSLNGGVDTLTVQNWRYDAAYRIDRVEFADGSVWNGAELESHIVFSPTENDDALYGGSGNDTIQGLGGDDRLYGNIGNDNLQGGDGNDSLQGDAGDDMLDGGAGNDSLTGGDGNDSLIGGIGNDSLNGGYGNDTYGFGFGSGLDSVSDYDYTANNLDTVGFTQGVKPADVSVQRDQSNLYLSLNGGTDRLVLQNWFYGDDYQIERASFADGTVWDKAELEQRAQALPGSDNDDTLTGGTGDNRLQGLGGDDTLNGNAGNDSLQGGDGNDNLQGGAGDDTLDGGAGNDSLTGGDGNDILVGGPGTDRLDGGYGNDAYVLGFGSGLDSVSEYDYTPGNLDTVSFAAGVNPTDVTVQRDQSNLYLSLNGGADRLVLQNWFYGDVYQIERASFADGTVWDKAQLEQRAQALPGSDNNDTLVGGSGDNLLQGLGGDDTLYGNAGNDTLQGGDGNDNLQGDAGDDTLDGGAGNDGLTGGDGNDTLVGGSGTDRLDGGYGNDTYGFGFGSGLDSVTDYDPTPGNLDTVSFAAGVKAADVSVQRDQNNLYLSLNGGVDRLVLQNWFSAPYQIERASFADGTLWDKTELEQRAQALPGSDNDDTLVGGSGDNLLQGLGSNDTLYGNAGNDSLQGGDGNDNLQGDAGDDTLDGGAGNDSLSGGDGNDILNGGTGNDSLNGGAGNDTYVFGLGLGLDSVSEYDYTPGNLDTVSFAAGVKAADVTVQRDQSSLYFSLNGGTDRLTLTNWFSAPYQIECASFADGTVWDASKLNQLASLASGTNNNDTLYGSASNDVISGLGGDDSLYGMNGNDTLDGGSGNDSLNGGAGDDIYVFGLGYGQDAITENDSTTGNVDTVKFAAGIAPADVAVIKGAQNLYLSLNNGLDRLTVLNWFANDAYKIEKVLFADNTAWNKSDLLSRAVSLPSEDDETISGGSAADNLKGFGGNDNLQGNAGDDTLDGGAGNDSLQGGDGNDTLIGGSGNDNLNGGAGNDTYVFGFGSGLDSVSEYDYTPGNLDTVSFAQGVKPADVTVQRDSSDLYLSLNGGADRLVLQNWFSAPYQIERAVFADGTVWDKAELEQRAQALPGSDNNDTLVGGSGDNLLQGLGGNDSLDGNAGNDSLQGGDGNDTLQGGAGDDTLDGGTGNDSLSGGDGNDTLNGGTGNDSLNGGAGNDTYVFGLGSGLDSVSEYDYTPGNLDTVSFAAGVNPTDVTVQRDQSNLYLSLNGGTDRLTLTNWFSAPYQIERATFADGTLWDKAELEQRAQALPGSENNDTLAGGSGDNLLQGLGGDDTLYGNAGNDNLQGGDGNDNLQGDAGDDTLDGDAGNDSLSGGDGNDTLNGGTGNDSLNGGAGNDTYVFGFGSGLDSVSEYDYMPGNLDTVSFAAGVNPADVTVQRDQSNLYLSLNGGADRLVLQNWFSAPYQIERATFADGTVWDKAELEQRAQALPGSDNDDTLTGGTGDNLLQGLGGNDTLNGNAGNDNLQGGDGNDSLQGSAGDDTLDGGSGNDSLQGSAGDDTLDGGSGNDSLSGGDGDDTLVGGSGNDRLDGGYGNDTYGFGLGSGRDTLYDYDPTPGNLDTVSFAQGVKPADVTVQRDQSNLYLSLNGGTDRLVLQNWFNAPYQIERASFADGTVWDKAELEQRAQALPGSDNDETLTGGSGDNLLQGLGGNDTLNGNVGNDTLQGGDGNDTLQGDAGDDTLDGGTGNNSLSGGDGNDILVGGPGNDTLNGGYGNDTYVFGLGSGQDSVSDYDPTPGNLDTVSFAQGVAPTDVSVQRDQNNLYLSLNGGTDRLTLTNWFYYGDAYQIERAVFADGTVWDQAKLGQLAGPLPGTDDDDTLYGNTGDDLAQGQGGNDTLYGYGGNDTLDGGTGNDSLQGGDGNDTLIGGAGNDSLNGGYGDDTYVFSRGFGQDVIAEFDKAVGSVDTVSFAIGITPSDISVQSDPSNLYLTLGNGSDRLTLSNWFSPNYKIERVAFADGTVWDATTLRGMVNHAPQAVAVIADQSTRQGQGFGYTVNATSFTDTDAGDSLTYNASAADGGALPTWLRFNPLNRTFSGTPGNGDVGNVSVKVIASDTYNASVIETFKIAVVNVNDAPAGTDKTVSLAEDGTYTFASADFGFTDPNDSLANALLAVKINSLPAAGTLRLNGTAVSVGQSVSAADIDAGRLTFTPAANANGTHYAQFTFQVQDDGGTANGGADLAITPNTLAVNVTPVNDAPTLANAIANQTGGSGVAFSFAVPANSFADIDSGDVLVYMTTLADGSALPAWLNFNPNTRLFSGTPGNADAGTLNLKVTATDQASASASGLFALTIDGGKTAFGGIGNDVLDGGRGNDHFNGGFGFDTAHQSGSLADYRVTTSGNNVILTHTATGEHDVFVDVERINFDSGSSLGIAYSTGEAVAQHLVGTWLHRDLTVAEGEYVQQHLATSSAADIVKAFLTLPEASGLQTKTADELLAGLGNNPHLVQLPAQRDWIGGSGDDQGYLPPGLALNVDGGAGYDVLRVHGGRQDVRVETHSGNLLLTELTDGSMVSLKNAEMIAFDSGENTVIAHNDVEGILGRLVHTFFNRDATVQEWQMGRDALARQVAPDQILQWFQDHAGLTGLNNHDYVQTVFENTLHRQPTSAELNADLARLDSGAIDRSWLAVEIAETHEAVTILGSHVVVMDGWV